MEPNLQQLSMLEEKLPPCTEESFLHLKQIYLDYCDEMTDDCISQFFASNVLEEVNIFTNERMTGRCLTNLKTTKLKSLALRSCWVLEFPPLLSLIDRLHNLTKLVLARACDEIRDQVHVLISEMPKLEYLTVLIDGVDNLKNSDIFFDSVYRLKNLKHLSSNFYAWDQHLEAVVENCKDLEVLKLLCWHVTGRGAAAASRIGARLTHFDLGFSKVSDDDVVGIVYACPNLKWLRLCNCDLRYVVRRVANARREQGASTPLKILIEECRNLEDRYGDGMEDDVLDIQTRDDEYDSDDVEDRYRY